MEILRLVSRGLTDVEIGERIFFSNSDPRLLTARLVEATAQIQWCQSSFRVNVS
jgi:hypothetical protein